MVLSGAISLITCRKAALVRLEANAPLDGETGLMPKAAVSGIDQKGLPFVPRTRSENQENRCWCRWYEPAHDCSHTLQRTSDTISQNSRESS